MAQPGRRSEVNVQRLQITLPADAADLLDRIVKISRYGRNRNDVAARIVIDWLHDHARSKLIDHFELKDTVKQFDARLEGRQEDTQ